MLLGGSWPTDMSPPTHTHKSYFM